jgi:hypothetical protein
MSILLDEAYFDWLYAQVGLGKRVKLSQSYRLLLRALFTKEFIWLVPNDDNRIADGKDLRFEFLETRGIPGSRISDQEGNWTEMGCSMLELFIGLAHRCSFETDEPFEPWFWQILKNIEIDGFNDARPFDKELVDAKLDAVIWRTFDKSGNGSIFPLHDTNQNQRKIELWYLLSQYILERY